MSQDVQQNEKAKLTDDQMEAFRTYGNKLKLVIYKMHICKYLYDFHFQQRIFHCRALKRKRLIIEERPNPEPRRTLPESTKSRAEKQ